MFRVIEILVLIGVICFVVQQIIAPALLGRPIFGMFRKEAKIKNEISEALQEYDETALENARDTIKDETTKLKGKN